MNAQTITSDKTIEQIKPSPTPKKLEPTMSGSEILVAALEREGVDTIFAYPGGASMEIHQALTRSRQIRTILPRHEQGGVFAAEGYARATGKVGVCMATSGPGATNLVTGIADAFMDSVPLVAITGQVSMAMIGRGAFQEVDIYGMTLPIVKHSYLVTDLHELPKIVSEAFHLAREGRPGPVLIDIPKNIQQARTQPIFPEPSEARTKYPTRRASDAQLTQVLDLISRAERPVLYVGGGIISGGAAPELLAFAEALQIPVTTTLMGCGAFPEDHPLSLRWLGMHGAAYANWAVNGEFQLRQNPEEPARQIAPGADLLLAFGVRFDDRVTGKVQEFCKRGTIVHIDIDAAELNKNKPAQLPINSDINFALRRMLELLAESPVAAPPREAWHQQIRGWKAKAPFRYDQHREPLSSPHVGFLEGQEQETILPQRAIELLHELTAGNAIIVTGVGQHQMWAAQFYRFNEPRQLITSGGLGSMGFGYPAALGAKVACPDRQVIDIDGDGSFLMNVQELAMAKVEKIAAKAIILNNQHLGMVMQWEDRFYRSNRGHTFLGIPEAPAQIYPDYMTIATGFGIKCERVLFLKDLRAALQRMLDADEPYLLELIVPHTEHVLPFIPAGKTVADMML
jgi:acetolactate synthase-1/2/3 large subunit